MNIRFMVHFNLPPLYGGPMILQYYQNMKNIFAAKIFSLPCPTVQRSSCLNKKNLVQEKAYILSLTFCALKESILLLS